jgi:hypothetical protein
MSSLARKIQKKLAPRGIVTPGKGGDGDVMASVIMKLNPKTGLMQEYHLTKGWR